MHACCPLQSNFYETVNHDMDLEFSEVHAEYVGSAEGTTNIQAVFADAPQGIADLDQEDNGVPLPEFSNESAVGPIKDGLVKATSQKAGALQRDECTQFHETSNASLNGEDLGVLSFEESTACETAAESSSNVSLGKVGEKLPYMVRNVVENADIVLGSARRPDSPLQKDNHSVSSSTSLQDPREVIAEMPVILIATRQMHISDIDRMDELGLQAPRNDLHNVANAEVKT